MKNNQLATSKSFGLLRIENIVSEFCIYCRILTGEMMGGITVQYASTIDPIDNTEDLKVF